MTPTSVTYRLDAHDCICSIEGPWDDFANRARAPECLGEELLGSNIFNAIADEMTQLFYRTLFDEVRREGHSIRIPYRCDGPHIRRK